MQNSNKINNDKQKNGIMVFFLDLMKILMKKRSGICKGSFCICENLALLL
jgi:hypothetical protein